MISDGVSKNAFIAYLKDLSEHKPRELKMLIIENAAFHTSKDMELPRNIILLPIPPYCPELNSAEKMWQYSKNRFINQRFQTMEKLKQWLHDMENHMENETIKSITGNHHYVNAFNKALNN